MKKNPWKLPAKNPTDHYYIEAGRGREFVVRRQDKADPVKATAKFGGNKWIWFGKEHLPYMYTFPQKVSWNEKHRMKNLFISLSITKLARSSCKL